jgi:putative ABC transport system permease protein
MLKLLSILWNSFKMALQELRVNKLRTFLSLFGITIGIFCIIGVLATVNSLERKVQDDIKKLGSNSIYIDKWEYGGGGSGTDYPWWKFIKRPSPKYEELQFIKAKSELAGNIAFTCSTNGNVSFENSEVSGTNFIGASEDFNKIQSLVVQTGRYISDVEFTRGTPTVVIGDNLATELFGKPERADGKEINFQGRKYIVVGILEKQGQSFANAFDFDNCLITPYNCFASNYNPDNSSPVIMVQGKSGVNPKTLKDELTAVMRQIRRISPTGEENFSLNDISVFAEQMESFFGSVTIGGWAIAGLSLVVGAFGVANIMFVTVRERTSQIGLKKAIGAKSKTILTEFLLESAFLCIIGGLIGLALVWILTKVLGTILPFPIFIAPNIIMLALSICVVMGVLSGIIPASIAARMNPVVAIRTK